MRRYCTVVDMVLCVSDVKRIGLLLFSLAANLRVQDVSGDAQHISMLPIIDIVSCYAHSGP